MATKDKPIWNTGLINNGKMEQVYELAVVRHGHWENYLKEGLRWKCSECGSRFETPYHYCPNCGAKMEKALQWEEPEINPCRGCKDYDGQGGCLSKGGCAERREDAETN